MNEVEKKIKNVQEMFEDIPIKDIESQSITIYGTAILDVIEVLNLIEKQEKEIEILKLTNNYLDIANKDYISKDKIREKIEELEDVLDLTESEKRFPKYRKQALIEEIRDLQELLEE